jgi:hypothetical protein
MRWHIIIWVLHMAWPVALGRDQRVSYGCISRPRQLGLVSEPGTCLSERRDLPKAVAALEHAVLLRPERTEPHFNLALLYERCFGVIELTLAAALHAHTREWSRSQCQPGFCCAQEKLPGKKEKAARISTDGEPGHTNKRSSGFLSQMTMMLIFITAPGLHPRQLFPRTPASSEGGGNWFHHKIQGRQRK